MRLSRLRATLLWPPAILLAMACPARADCEDAQVKHLVMATDAPVTLTLVVRLQEGEAGLRRRPAGAEEDEIRPLKVCRPDGEPGPEHPFQVTLGPGETPSLLVKGPLTEATLEVAELRPPGQGFRVLFVLKGREARMLRITGNHSGFVNDCETAGSRARGWDAEAKAS